MNGAKIITVAAAVVITALSIYTGILRGQVRDMSERAAENLRRVEACESALMMERRARTAATEAQGYADTQRQRIEVTRADMAQRAGAIVDSGQLDERVCELARAAYHSALCAGADGRTLPSSAGTAAP